MDKGHIWGQRAETQGFFLGVEQSGNQNRTPEVLLEKWLGEKPPDPHTHLATESAARSILNTPSGGARTHSRQRVNLGSGARVGQKFTRNGAQACR